MLLSQLLSQHRTQFPSAHRAPCPEAHAALRAMSTPVESMHGMNARMYVRCFHQVRQADLQACGQDGQDGRSSRAARAARAGWRGRAPWACGRPGRTGRPGRFVRGRAVVVWDRENMSFPGPGVENNWFCGSGRMWSFRPRGIRKTTRRAQIFI